MYSIEEIEKKIKSSVGIKRYNHSIGVMETAIKLARFNGENINNAALAGLLHDCGKFENTNEILKKCKDYNVDIDEYMKMNVQLLHAPLSAEIAKKDYGIHDKNIFNSIKYHTTGRKNMSLLEKIIYIADYIEPNRNFPGVEEVRILAFKDINKALLKAFDNTIQYVIQNNWIIHENTIFARNSLILNELLDKNS